MFALPLSFVLLAGFIGTSSAQGTSLYVPGFDPQPLSVNVIGVGSDGRTTYELLPGTPTGTFDEADFIGTATLVEGPNDAFLSYVDPDPEQSLTLVESCTFQSAGLAACVVVDATSTVTGTEADAPFLVQGGATLSGTSTSDISTVTSPSLQSTTGSSTGSQPGSTSSGVSQTSTSTPKPTTNAALSRSSRISGGIFAVLLALSVAPVL